MKVALTAQQRHFFQNQRYLELEGAISPSHIESLCSGIRAAVAERLKLDEAQAEAISPHEAISVGRDLWRSDPRVKRIVCSAHLAAVASELSATKLIRLGYDQLVIPLTHKRHSNRQFSHLSEWLQSSSSLEASSCLQGLCCGAIICLQGDPKDFQADDGAIFPCQRGNVTFFSADREISFAELEERHSQQFLLIAYANYRAQYILQPNDPFVHYLKGIGYVFGDSLNDREHPILTR